MSDRLDRQLCFLFELDALKHVERRSWLLSRTRRENSAEHSWHVAIVAWLLLEHADFEVDRERVLRMLLVHDVVEIDAGDTFRYDEAGKQDQAEREARAAERLFGLLPPDQGEDLRALWQEFETRETPEARFAAAVDRLMPLLHNHATEGMTWREAGVRGDRVLAANAPIGNASKKLWALARERIEEAMQRGHLDPPEDEA